MKVNMFYFVLFLSLLFNYSNAAESSIIAPPQAISGDDNSYLYKYKKFMPIGDESEDGFVFDEKADLVQLQKLIQPCLDIARTEKTFLEIKEESSGLINLRKNKIVSFMPIGPDAGTSCKHGGTGSLARNFLISLLLKNFIKNDRFQLAVEPGSNILS